MTTGVEDRDVVDQESSCDDVNVDVTIEGIDEKDSCQDVNFEGATLSEDAIMDITLEGKGKGKGKEKGKDKGKRKGKGKGKGKREGENQGW